MGRLEDKTAIVTGGSGGIGSATGRRFAAEGASVLLVDLDEDGLRRAVASAESERISHFVADVSDAAQTQAYVRAAVERYGGLDIVFANAGIEGKIAPIVDGREEDFDRVLAVNLRGVWLAIRAAVPELRARGAGSILVTSSVAGLVGYAGLAPYACSKHALVGLVRTAALECASTNIRVNAIHPGPISNRMMESVEQQLSPDAPQDAKKDFEDLVPLGRYGTNEEIAALAVFLASDESRYCTGASFVADGGFVAR